MVTNRQYYFRERCGTGQSAYQIAEQLKEFCQEGNINFDVVDLKNFERWIKDWLEERNYNEE